MDRMGANFGAALTSLREKLGAHPLILTIPWGEEERFQGVIDLLGMTAIKWREESLGADFEELEIPGDYREQAAAAREALVEALAEVDDEVMEVYLAEQPLTAEVLKAGIQRATLALKGVPTYCGSALRNKGIQPLLEGIKDFLPDPAQVPPIVGQNPKTGKMESRPPSPETPLAALAFKIMVDQGQRLTYVRIYSGTLKFGQEVYNSIKQTTEKVARILRMHANKREPLEEAHAGTIVALLGLKATTTGDTLCSRHHPVVLEPISSYVPVISLAIEPVTRDDQERLTPALERVCEEDPSLKVHTDEDTGQTLLSGMGELHLEVIIHRLEREFHAHVRAGRPQVVYRETIASRVEETGVFDRELAGRHHFAEVRLTLAPRPRGEGNSFASLLPEGHPAQSFVPLVAQAVSEALEGGAVYGHPAVDVAVALTEATIREGQASEMAFRVAAMTAVKQGLHAGQPQLLQPIMKVEIIAPEEFTGEVMGDFAARKGKVEHLLAKGPVRFISGLAPLSEMFGYATALRSLSQGRGTFTLQFDHHGYVESSKQ
jgi:elongation factor G